MLGSAIAFLDSATAFVTNDDLQQTPGEIRGLLSDARGVIGSEEVQALPGELRLLVANLQSASGDLSALLAELREARAVERLMAAVDVAGSAAASFDTAMQGVPALTERVTALAGTAMGTVRMAASNSILPEYDFDAVGGMEHVAALADRYAAYAKHLREGIASADDLGDMDTSDLYTEISRTIDKRLWFLEAHLVG